MTKKHFLLAVALVWFAAAGAVAQEGGQGRDKNDREGGSAGLRQDAFTGKITKIDTTKRTLVIGDLMQRDGRTGTGDKGTDGGTGGDKGTGGLGGDKGTAGGANKTMSFTLTETAKISLDGKEATMKDLKEGLWARVHIDRAGKGGVGGDDKRRTDDKDGAGKEGDRGQGGVGGTTGNSMHHASRVEAFTKRPERTGTGAGERERDKDR